MTYLVAAVVLVGLLCLLDLLLTVGMIKRLRQHTELLNGLRAGSTPEVMLPVGSEAGEFAAATTDGDPVSPELLAGRTLVGFFSPSCQPCKEKLPSFLDAAPGVDGGRQQVLAVVVGDAEECAEMATRLAPVARVVVEPPDGPVAAAFGVDGFPAFGLLDGRQITASGWAMQMLPVPTGA